nr:Gfo/Idh/MocA family oxidoreductase [Candidatus Sigynarchaeota archaeon]
MAAKVYKFIVVGLGHISDHWLPLFSDQQKKMFGNTKRVEIAALVDPDQTTHAKREKYACGDAPCYVQLEDAFKEVESDAVLVLTPPQYHARYVWTAIQQLNHVLTEKPFVTEMNDLKHMIGLFKTIEEEHLICVVNQQYRWAPRMQAIRKAVDDGAIGTIGFITSYFNEPDYHFNLWWRQLHGDISAFNWYVHHYDTMRFLLKNRKPVEVYGKLIRVPYSKIIGESTVFLQVTFEDGIEWSYNGSQEGRGWKTPGQSMFTIHGSDGMIENPRDGPPMLYKVGDEKGVPLMPDPGDAQAPYPDYWHVTLKKFVESLDAKKPIDEDVTTFQNNIWTISIPMAARESHRQKRRINMKEFMESL